MLSGALVRPRGVLRAGLLASASRSWRVADDVIQNHSACLVETRRLRLRIAHRRVWCFLAMHRTWAWAAVRDPGADRSLRPNRRAPAIRYPPTYTLMRRDMRCAWTMQCSASSHAALRRGANDAVALDSLEREWPHAGDGSRCDPATADDSRPVGTPRDDHHPVAQAR